MIEVELKFSVPERATFDRLCQLETLAGYRLAPVGVNRVHDRYLDTTDRALLRAGYACRVRREGDARLATLKGLSGAQAGSGLHRRAEHEVAVEEDDPAAWPASPARDLALRLSQGRPLRALFSLRQRRHRCLLFGDAAAHARPVAELSLDAVALQGGSSSRPYYELEIELLDGGSESDLCALAEALRTTWGLQPQPRSKFERGLASIDGGV